MKGAWLHEIIPLPRLVLQANGTYSFGGQCVVGLSGVQQVYAMDMTIPITIIHYTILSQHYLQAPPLYMYTYSPLPCGC